MGDERREKRSKIKNLWKARANMKAALRANNTLLGEVANGQHIMCDTAYEQCQARVSVLIGKIVDAEAVLETLGEKILGKMIDELANELSGLEDKKLKAKQEFDRAVREDFRLKKKEDVDTGKDQQSH